MALELLPAYYERLNDWKKVSGSFSTVYRYMYNRKTFRAVKVVELQKLKDDPQMLEREIDHMTKFKHPHIVSLIETLHNDHQTCLIMNWADCDLLQQMSHQKYPQPEGAVRHIFRQILSALIYSHQQGVAHLDIKAENVLYFSTQQIYALTDWGHSRSYQLGQKLRYFGGTFEYISPEIYKYKSYDPEKVDVWALGVLLFFMYHGKQPFRGRHMYEIRDKVIQQVPRHPHKLGLDLENLLYGMLDKDQQSRYNLQQVKDSDWLKL